MQDVFTADDRAALNAAMTAGSGSRYAELLAQDPAPGSGLRIGVTAGLVLVGLVAGGILASAFGLIGLIALVVLVVAGFAVSQPLAGSLHRHGLRRTAQEEVVGGWAAARGWRMAEAIGLAGSTPLLREGDERETGWGVEGQLDAATPFVAGHYEYTDIRTVTDTDADGTTSTRTERDTYPFSVALIPAPGVEFPALALAKGSTGGFMSRVSGALSDLKPVELESSEFNDAFRLMVADGADEVAVRARFSPAVQVAFIERGANDTRVELEGGQLLVARAGAPDHDDLGALVDLLADAVWLRAVLTQEPAGRLPEIEPLRRLLVGDAAHGAS
jgi:hypothetical protein